MSKIKFSIGLLLTLACFASLSAAQYSSGDSGLFVILSAQYWPPAAHHVDVTNRLKGNRPSGPRLSHGKRHLRH